MILNPRKIFEQKIIIDALEKNIQQNGIDIRIEETILVQPKSFKNVLCVESVFLPENMVALFHIRSSFSRRGIFLTSGIWDSGFEGRIGCSIYNLSDGAVTILAHERIGQILFIEADSAGLYNGKWQHEGLDEKSK